MTHDLGFIPTIAEKLHASGSQQSLSQFLAELGYREDEKNKSDASQNFGAFMAEVGAAFAQDALAQLEESFKTDLFLFLHEPVKSNTEEHLLAARELLQADPEWSQVLAFVDAEGQARPPDVFSVNLLCDGASLETLVLSAKYPRRSFSLIVPGFYAIDLETGLRLWEHRITEKDVRWIRAFGREPFRVAAATEGADIEPAIDDTIMDGVLRIQIFTGLEHGRLDITWHPEGRGLP